MSLNKFKRKQLITYRTEQARQTAATVEFLIESNYLNLAVSRIYFGMYYMLLALAAKNDQLDGGEEELLDWFNESFVKSNLVEARLYRIIQNSRQDARDADYTPFIEFSKDDLAKKLCDLQGFISGIEQLLKKNPGLVTETLHFLRITHSWLGSEDLNSTILSLAKRYKRFVSTRLFQENEKYMQGLDEYLKDQTNLRVEAQVELRISDSLDAHSELATEMEELNYEVKQMLENYPELESLDRQLKSEGNTETHILVPWDFSEVAGFALEHAVQFAQITGGRISLIHIAKKQKDADDAKKQFLEVLDKAQADFGVRPEILIRVGNLFTDINQIAEEINASLVVMGTHGMIGMQRITGSKALKVIAGTKIPFVVVQAPPARKQIQDVIFPVDYRKENKQKLNQARFLSKYYKLKFHICTPSRFANSAVEQKVKNNIYFMQGYFNQHGIEHQTHMVEGARDVVEATMALAASFQTDLILIITTKDIAAYDYILGAEEQKIIANEAKIPVMCVTPPKGLYVGGGSGTSG